MGLEDYFNLALIIVWSCTAIIVLGGVAWSWFTLLRDNWGVKNSTLNAKKPPPR